MKLIFIILFVLLSLVGLSQSECPLPQYNITFTVDKPLNNNVVGTLYACDPNGDNLEWYIVDNSNLWNVNNGVITANNIDSITDNKYSITIGVVDDGVPQMGFEANVDIIINEPVNINYYPNPFTDNLNIDLLLHSNYNIEIKIINQLGQEVKSITNSDIDLFEGFYKYIWNGNNYNNIKVSSGIYYLMLIIDNKPSYEKIIFIE